MRSGVRTLYKKLLALYPQGFTEQLGESMEQTANDLWNEKKRRSAGVFFVLSIFTETAIGIVREHLLTLTEGDVVKSILLSLPLGLTFMAFMFDIEPLARPLTELFTIKGQPGEINMLGRIVIFGGLLLLPIDFFLNVRPLLKREVPEGKTGLNLIVGAAILLLIVFTWGGLIVEEIYCFRGIHCD